MSQILLKSAPTVREIYPRGHQYICWGLPNAGKKRGAKKTGIWGAQSRHFYRYVWTCAYTCLLSQSFCVWCRSWLEFERISRQSQLYTCYCYKWLLSHRPLTGYPNIYITIRTNSVHINNHLVVLSVCSPDQHCTHLYASVVLAMEPSAFYHLCFHGGSISFAVKAPIRFILIAGVSILLFSLYFMRIACESVYSSVLWSWQFMSASGSRRRAHLRSNAKDIQHIE